MNRIEVSSPKNGRAGIGDGTSDRAEGRRIVGDLRLGDHTPDGSTHRPCLRPARGPGHGGSRGASGSRRASGSLGLLGLLALVAALLAGACNGPVLANPPAPRPTVPPSPTVEPRSPDPLPILLPRDDGPHDRLTEWWYYTGHLADGTGGRWGFELVIFRAERGGLPVTWASHLALTDETGGTFRYAQRSEIGPQVDGSPRDAGGSPTGFALGIAGFDPTRSGPLGRPPWLMAGAGGRDRLAALADPDEALGDALGVAFGIELMLEARKPPALHDGDGWIDVGPAGGSYYYSRTAMDAVGSVTIGDRTLAVTGDAWFDHQWGDFIAVGSGGWDWFAIGLEDGVELTLSLVRASDGSYPLVYGTLVEAGGRSRRLDRDAFSVETTASWSSPRTGTTYPAGWRIELAGEGLTINLEPTVPQQELDTRETTGVVYWEGSQRVTATRDGRALGGQAYVELTGYDGAG